MFNPPQLGIPVTACNVDGLICHGYVSGFMGNPEDKEGRYSIQITFHQGNQPYCYYSIREEGKLWSKVKI
jgi:hypothetical protein